MFSTNVVEEYQWLLFFIVKLIDNCMLYKHFIPRTVFEFWVLNLGPGCRIVEASAHVHVFFICKMACPV